MDILIIKSNHTELECQNIFNCIKCSGEHIAYSRECEMRKKEKRITEIKYIRNISFPEARKIVERTQKQPSYAYVTKNGNEEKEDTKQKREELNKLMNELKNVIEILKSVTKETIMEHISTVQDECEIHNQNQEKSPKQRKGKIKTKQKTLINEPLFNRFSQWA